MIAGNGDPWFAAEQVLARFGRNGKASRNAYEAFVADGVAQGKRNDLIGGGLFRSAGGWSEVMSARSSGIFLKSDEWILGDSDFVERILESADEAMERRISYRHQGMDLDRLAEIVAEIVGVSTAELEAPGRQPHRVQARSLYCYWATRELGATTTSLAKRFNLTQPAISMAVSRGERLVAEYGWYLPGFMK